MLWCHGQAKSTDIPLPKLHQTTASNRNAFSDGQQDQEPTRHSGSGTASRLWWKAQAPMQEVLLCGGEVAARALLWDGARPYQGM